MRFAFFRKNSARPVSVCVATDPGCIRAENEDDFYVTDIGCKPDASFSGRAAADGQDCCFFAVFDGMGGEAYGAEASRIAAETLREFSGQIIRRNTVKAQIEQFLALANQRIREMIEKNKCSRSGCTMALTVLLDGTVYPFSVGDSRIYRISQSAIEQISEDQTLAVKKLKANIYTEEEARTSPDAHKITSYIGLDSRGAGVSFHAYTPFTLADDILLLCSDGLTDMCSDEEIQAVFAGGNSSAAANALVELARQNGGEDNITCITVNAMKGR